MIRYNGATLYSGIRRVERISFTLDPLILSLSLSFLVLLGNWKEEEEAFVELLWKLSQFPLFCFLLINVCGQVFNRCQYKDRNTATATETLYYGEKKQKDRLWELFSLFFRQIGERGNFQPVSAFYEVLYEREDRR